MFCLLRTFRSPDSQGHEVGDQGWSGDFVRNGPQPVLKVKIETELETPEFVPSALFI